jgi:uncharacterized protein YlxW (UPF0749 family)
LLLDLATNPLDPGYAAASARRGPNPPRRWYDVPAVALGCVLIGFIVVVAYVHTHRGAPEAAKVQQNLVNRVRAGQRDDVALQAQAEHLSNQLQAARSAALAGASGTPRNLGQLQQAAGQTAITGPGLTVTLAEPASATATAGNGRVGTTPIAATNILTDRDVRSVVNELWADGAQAVAVNGVRLTPVSAIRFAGQAVLVDFHAISSPYVIQAIGKPDLLATNFASSAVASRYQTLAGADGIGFSFDESNALRLPAGAPFEPRYAATPSPSPAPTGGTR